MENLLILAQDSNEQKFTSKFLVEQINLFRKEEGNETELAHFNFLVKIEKEFEEEIGELKIQATSYKDASNRDSKCYELTFEHSLQLLMSESKTVRKRCVGIMKAQQAQIEAFKAPKTFREALLLAAEQQAQIEQQSNLIATQTPKVDAFERVLDGANTYTLDTISDTLNIGRTTLAKKLEELNWKTVKDPKGTSSTRYSENMGYAKTVFEIVVMGKSEVKVKKIVITKKGLDYLISKINQIVK